MNMELYSRPTGEPIHVTERSRFKWCRRNWSYYMEGLQSVDAKPTSALRLGSLVHHGLALYYLDQVPSPADGFDQDFWTGVKRDELYPEELDDLNKMYELGMSMLDRYVQHWADDPLIWDVVAVEKPLRTEIKLPDGRVEHLEGTIDLLVRWRGRLWVVDHKTAQTFTDEGALEFDDQMSTYLALVWANYGEVPGGAIYNQLLKRVPEKPALVYKGTRLSKAQIYTTRETYLEAIRENGFDESDYADVLASLEFKPFFQRLTTSCTETALRRFIEVQLPQEAADMTGLNIPIYPNMSQSCTWGCEYKRLCLARQTGGDEQSLRDMLFTVDTSNTRRRYDNEAEVAIE